MVVTRKRNGLDLDLGLAVYLESDPYRVLDYGVVDLNHIHIRVDEAFLLIIILYNSYG